jgi:RimJ/RimL family protein N-acetyltransferase
MELETERLIIRDYKIDDKYNIFKLHNDKNVTYCAPYLYKESLHEAEDRIKYILNDAKSADRTHYYFIIELKSTKAFIGTVGYAVIGAAETATGDKTEVEIEYFLSEAYWNMGYATEALARILKYAFENKRIPKASAWCLAENAASEKVMIKCGMRKTAYLPKPKMYHGVLKDRLKYQITEEDYAEIYARRG